jgi:hypothetical protein
MTWSSSPSISAGSAKTKLKPTLDSSIRPGTPLAAILVSDMYVLVMSDSEQNLVHYNVNLKK